MSEPDPGPDTLANLGPLRRHPARHARLRSEPSAHGPEYERFLERIALHPGVFEHRDENTLRQIAEPTANPLSLRTPR